MIEFIYNDGGRSSSGFKGTTGDCVTRAIAIVTQKPYKEVYDALWKGIDEFSQGRSRAAKRAARGGGKRGTTPRNGVDKKVFHKYLLSLGMRWVPTMFIGQGCKIHLRADELPSGRLIVSVSKHLTAVIDGVVNDIYNPAREVHCTEYINGELSHHIEERCVYGYYIK
jgi:hypothetical protein